MLNITRKSGERVFIGDDVSVQVNITYDKKGHARVRLAIDAPLEVNIVREELVRPVASRKTLTLINQ